VENKLTEKKNTLVLGHFGRRNFGIEFRTLALLAPEG